MKDIPVEILCNAPNCLQIDLQSILYCKYVSSEIKELIRDFLKMSNMCVYMAQETPRRSMDIPFKILKTRFFTHLANVTKDVTESPESEETTEFNEISNESTESTEVSTKPEISLEESTEFINTTMMTALKTIEYTEPISTPMKVDTLIKEETTTITSTTAVTTTSSLTTTITLSTTTTLPTTTTILPKIITTTLPTTTILPKTTTALPTTTITEAPTTTTPTTTTTILPTITTTFILSTIITAPSAGTELPIVNIEIELEHSKRNTNNLYDNEIMQSSISITSTSRSCEFNDCSNKERGN